MISPVVILIFNFLAGTASVIFGVNRMSAGLEKLNGPMIEKTLKMFTGKVLTAFASGTVITTLVQSSTAVMLITVGLVNSGIMKLPQAIGVIYGANIGTTVTAQLMAFRLRDGAVPIIVFAFMIVLISKKTFFKSLGTALMGLGFLFLGINIMNWGVPLIKESQKVYEIFMQYGKNPYIGLCIGIVTTMLVQSSSATVGITIVLFNAGLISFDAALGLTLGDNIGTCITAQLASLGTSLPARRTAWAHTLYNGIGVLIAIILLAPFADLIEFVTLAAGQDKTRLVANTHTVFNMLSAILFLPLTKYYVRFIEWIIPDSSK